ncbi:MAG: helix-turn-helix domain-containing protein [Lachnospiraceae bacterium]|nr:helix-turn-helix domain-containing protein [Lachnospiraceae bacterium]
MTNYQAYEKKRDEITQSDVIYRCIGDNLKNGIVACGFMKKETAERSQYHFSNEFYSCFLLLRGSGEYITEDGERLPLEAGDLVQRVPGIVHSTRVDPDGQWLEFFISVSADFYEAQKKLGILSSTPVKKKAFNTVDLEQYKSLIRKLKAATQNELPTISLELERELLYMFGYGKARRDNANKDDLLQSAHDVLEQNLDREISVEKLAGDMQMGYESFRKDFRKKYGISPGKYRIEKKMEQACMLLESGIPIKEIAQMVGYEDVYSFSKQFTKTYHIAPGRFRVNSARNGGYRL